MAIGVNRLLKTLALTKYDINKGIYENYWTEKRFFRQIYPKIITLKVLNQDYSIDTLQSRRRLNL